MFFNYTFFDIVASSSSVLKSPDVIRAWRLFFTRESRYNTTALLSFILSKNQNPADLLSVTSYDFYANLGVAYASYLTQHTSDDFVAEYLHALLQNEMSDQMGVVLCWFVISLTKQLVLLNKFTLLGTSEATILCPYLFIEIGKSLLKDSSSLSRSCILMLLSFLSSLPCDPLRSEEMKQWCTELRGTLPEMKDVGTYAMEEAESFLSLSDLCERDERFWIWSLTLPFFVENGFSLSSVLHVLSRVFWCLLLLMLIDGICGG